MHPERAQEYVCAGREGFTTQVVKIEYWREGSSSHKLHIRWEMKKTQPGFRFGVNRPECELSYQRPCDSRASVCFRSCRQMWGTFLQHLLYIRIEAVTIRTCQLAAHTHMSATTINQFSATAFSYKYPAPTHLTHPTLPDISYTDQSPHQTIAT